MKFSDLFPRKKKISSRHTARRNPFLCRPIIEALEDRCLLNGYIPELPKAGTMQGTGLDAVVYVPELHLLPDQLPEKKLVTIMNNGSNLIFPIIYGSNSTEDETQGTVTRGLIDPDHKGTGWQGKYRVTFSAPQAGGVTATAIVSGNDFLFGIDMDNKGAGYQKGETVTAVKFESLENKPLGTGAIVTGHPSDLLPGQNKQFALYDPKDPIKNTYRGYIGEQIDGKNRLGLQPGHQVTVQIPVAFWDGGRIYMVDPGSVPLTSKFDPGFPLQPNAIWTFNDSLTPSPIEGIGPGLSYLVGPSSPNNPLDYSANFKDPSRPGDPGNPNGLVLWYHEQNSKPRVFGLATPAVLTEATFRDLKQPNIAPNMLPREIQLIDNYDVSYVDSLALSASMEATRVPTNPPTPGNQQFAWLGSDLSTVQIQELIKHFTTNNIGINSPSPQPDPNGLGQYFGGLGWDQFYLPPNYNLTASGSITSIDNNNPDGKTRVTVHTGSTAGLVEGSLVEIKDVTTGQPAINSTWTVINITPQTFVLADLAGNNITPTPNQGSWASVPSTGIHTLKIPAGYDAIVQSASLNVASQFNKTKFNLLSGGDVLDVTTFGTGLATKGTKTITGVKTSQAKLLAAGMIIKDNKPKTGNISLFPLTATIASIQLGDGENNSVITMSTEATASGSPGNDGVGGSFAFVGSNYLAPSGKIQAPNLNKIIEIDPKVGILLRKGMTVTGPGIPIASNTVPATLIQDISLDFTTITLSQNASAGSGAYTFFGAPKSYVLQTLINNWYAWADYYVDQLKTGPAAAPTGTFEATTVTNAGRLDINSLTLKITDNNFDMNQLRVGDVVTGTTQSTPISSILTTIDQPVTINTSSTAGLQNDCTVTITGVINQATNLPASINGTWVVTNLTGNSFKLLGTVGKGETFTGGNWVFGTLSPNTTSDPSLNYTIVSFNSNTTGANARTVTLSLPVAATFVKADTFTFAPPQYIVRSSEAPAAGTTAGTVPYKLDFPGLPSIPISSVSNDLNQAIKIFTADTSLLAEGQQITISGVTGGQNINGTWTVTKIVANTSFELAAVTGVVNGSPKGTGVAPTGTLTWSPANNLQFAQTVYDVMQSFSLLVDPNTIASRSASLLGYIIGGNAGTFEINQGFKNKTGRDTLLPHDRTHVQIRDELKSVLRGVYNFNAIPDQSKWYPSPATPTAGAKLNGENIKFGIYNLDPYVWFVHTVLHNSSYGFSFDDDVANGQAASSTLQIAVGGNAYTEPLPSAPFNNLPNHEGFAPWAQWGTQESMGFVDTTSQHAKDALLLPVPQVTISGLNQAAVARLSAADPVKDHPGAHIVTDIPGFPNGATIVIVNANVASVVNKPILSIDQGGTQIRINVTNADLGNLGAGEVVTISGSGGANGRWVIENVVKSASQNSFELKGSTFSGSYPSGGTWSWDPSFVTFQKPADFTPPTDNVLHPFKFSTFLGTNVPENIVPQTLQGAPDTDVIINGKGFIGVYADGGVSFNGYPSEKVEVLSDTQLKARVPHFIANANGTTYPGRTGKIGIRNQSGTAYSTADFTIGDAGLTVTPNTAKRAQNAPTLIITGTGFDGVTPGNNLVQFNLGAFGAVTAATTTQLTVTFSTPPNALDNLTVVVTANGATSGDPVQVATIVAPPTVTQNTANHIQNAATLIITGTGFDPVAAGNLVLFNLGAIGAVTQASPTQLTVTFSKTPTSTGSLTAVVNSFGGDSGTPSGTPVQVATVVAAAAPTVTLNTANRAQNAQTLVITGTGFDTTPANNTVAFNLSAVGTVTAATSTQLTVTFTTPPNALDNLTAVVTAHGQDSGAPVQVATIVAPPTVTLNTANHVQTAQTILIDGTGFDPVAAGNSVVFNLGAVGTVTAATATQLTVTFSTTPSLGNLTAVVTSFGGSSGAAVQVATVVAAPPTVTLNTANRAQNAPTLVITGTGFDTTAANNSVAFSPGAVGTVTAATPTQLTVTFTTPPNALGSLTAVVTTNGQSSGAPVQVATVVAPPTVTLNTANHVQSAATIVINGTGFDTTAAGNTVAFNLGAVGTVTAATATQLTVTFSTTPSLGNLTAVVTSFGGSSGAPVQVATVVAAAPTVTLNTTNRAQNAPTLVITGTGFSTTAANNSVAFNLGAVGTVTAATPTQLTVAFTTPPTSLGNLTAVVTTNGLDSGAAVQVATVVAPPTVTLATDNQPQNATTIVIEGTGFDAAAPANNTVVFNLGAVGTVTLATDSELIVTFSTTPTSLGALTAVVTSNGGSSGAPVQVATVVAAAAPTVTPSTIYQSRDSTTLVINGTGFSTTPGNNTVAFNLGAVGTVSAATATQLTVTFSIRPTLGDLTAVVTTNGLTSGAPTQVAIVVTAEERWVYSLYRVILGREGSQAEVDGWASRVLTQGREAVVRGIEESIEGRRHLVSVWYQTYLGRAASADEAAAWANQILAGQTEKQVLASILSGDEYYQRAQALASGATPDQKFVRLLFQDFLGRSGSDSEVAFWADLVPTKGRAFVIQEILGSLEARSLYIERLYVRLLDRTPDAAELNGWLSQSQLDDLRLRIGFEASNEFYVNG